MYVVYFNMHTFEGTHAMHYNYRTQHVNVLHMTYMCTHDMYTMCTHVHYIHDIHDIHTYIHDITCSTRHATVWQFLEIETRMDNCLCLGYFTAYK